MEKEGRVKLGEGSIRDFTVLTYTLKYTTFEYPRPEFCLVFGLFLPQIIQRQTTLLYFRVYVSIYIHTDRHYDQSWKESKVIHNL